MPLTVLVHCHCHYDPPQMNPNNSHFLKNDSLPLHSFVQYVNTIPWLEEAMSVFPPPSLPLFLNLSQLKYSFARRKGALFTHNYPSSITRPSTRGQAPARPPSRHSFTGGNYAPLALGQPLDSWSLSARPLGGTLHFLWELTAQLCDASALWQCHIHTSEA